jgi:hypothetical protein
MSDSKVLKDRPFKDGVLRFRDQKGLLIQDGCRILRRTRTKSEKLLFVELSKHLRAKFGTHLRSYYPIYRLGIWATMTDLSLRYAVLISDESSEVQLDPETRKLATENEFALYPIKAGTYETPEERLKVIRSITNSITQRTRKVQKSGLVPYANPPFSDEKARSMSELVPDTEEMGLVDFAVTNLQEGHLHEMPRSEFIALCEKARSVYSHPLYEDASSFGQKQRMTVNAILKGERNLNGWSARHTLYTYTKRQADTINSKLRMKTKPESPQQSKKASPENK